MLLRSTRCLLIFSACIYLCLLTTIMHSPHALAAVDPITVTSQTDTVTFPKTIDFQVSANDTSSNIIQATIYIKYSNTNTSSPYTIAAPTPAHTVTLHWYANIASNNFVTPGTVVTYYWRVLDAQANVHTDATQTFTVIDTRFTWQHLNQGQLQVNWYNRGADFGQSILSKAVTNIKRIAGNLGGNPLHPINIWIYQTDNDFHGSLPPGTYEWVGGIAFPVLNQASIVAQDTNDLTLIRDMPHELTHLLFHQLAGPQSLSVPTWFDEGMAVYNQIYHESAMKQTFQQALSNHSLLRLNDISLAFPADANQAYLAYAQSWNLVSYMYATFGTPKIATLIKTLNNPTTSFNDALQLSFGMDQAHIENQWRVSLQQPATLTPEQTSSPPLPSLSQVHVASDPYAPFLILLGILLIVLPMIGLGSLFTYQHRSRQRVSIASQAQAIINTALPSYTTNQQTYADPSRYTSPYPAYPTYPPQSQRVLPDTSKGQEGLRYQQEYNNHYPDKRAPQE